MSEDIARQVARQIEDAFADTPYPGDANIGWDGIDETLRGKHWRDIPLDIIIRDRSEISFLTSAGFRYYLPAFMLAVLRHYQEVDQLSEYVVVSLSPEPQGELPHPNERDLSRWLTERTARFSPAQSSAVLAFLKSYRVLHAADFAESVYSSLLDSALQFWEAKVKDNTTK